MSTNDNADIILGNDQVISSHGPKRSNAGSLPRPQKYQKIEEDIGNDEFDDAYLMKHFNRKNTKSIPRTNTTTTTSKIVSSCNVPSNTMVQKNSVSKTIVSHTTPSQNVTKDTIENVPKQQVVKKYGTKQDDETNRNRPSHPIIVNENSKITNYTIPLRYGTPLRALGRTPISYFQLNEYDDDRTFNNTIKLNRIIDWLNFRLFEKKFNKQWSGLYLWSHQCSVGKTTLCQVLGKIFKGYPWVFGDKDWQQRWDTSIEYDFIIYDAMNSDLLPFRQIEAHGDKEDIVVSKRNQHDYKRVKPKTPYIINSNKPMEQLGYKEQGFNMIVWKARLLSICLDDGCNLFPLIKKIIEEYNIYLESDDPIPEGFGDCHYF